MPDTIVAGFRCGDLLLGVTVDNLAGTATLSWSDNRLELPQAISASGARYADGQGNEFWNKGNRASLSFANAEPLECTASDETSPWDEARSRGVAFRGIGTEPGWTVEVDGGDAPSLRASLDYGEHQVEVEHARIGAEGRVFGGSTADGIDVELGITPGPCSDGMSDQTYPASAELRVGEQTLRGCGAFLDR